MKLLRLQLLSYLHEICEIFRLCGDLLWAFVDFDSHRSRFTVRLFPVIDIRRFDT